MSCHLLAVCFLLVTSLAYVLNQEVPLNETINYSSNEIPTENLEYLCHHYYKDEFVVSAEVLENGCRLDCVLLKSSGAHGSNFFDTSVTKTHATNEGLRCDAELDSLKCVNGTCIEPPETGKALIGIYNATVSPRDPMASDKEGDPYVKIFLDQKYLLKTKTIENSNRPVWNQAIMTPVITTDTQISLIVLDRSSAHEQILLTIQTNVDLTMALEKNGTVTCGPPSVASPSKLCYSITWFPGFT